MQINTLTWDQIGQHLETLLETPLLERKSRIIELSQGERKVQEMLNDLLQVEEKYGNTQIEQIFTRIPTPNLEALNTQEEAFPNRIGTVLGKYELVELIGRGGMGEVYKAKRNDHIQQSVAIKILPPTIRNYPHLLERFQREQTILAHLNHPNIAHFLDASQTPENQPFFVMEYVDGIPITTYCDEHNLSIKARLALFKQFCMAMQYAHEQLIIHRDIKPQNILVTADGQVKILDFGIASQIEANQESVETLGWSFTPDFASPEQIKHDPLTVASDVYSSGVLLYELLTGQRPFHFLGLNLPQMMAQFEQKAPKASKATTQNLHSIPSFDPNEIAKQRQTTPEKLKKNIEGDLDIIVAKTLQIEKPNRYATMQLLIDDLDRYLQAKPIQARPPTWLYRINQFVQRNFNTVAWAFSIFVNMMLIAFGLLYQANQRTEAELHENRTIQEFITRFVFSGDAGLNEGLQLDSLQARNLIDLAKKRIHNDLTNSPRAKVSLWISLIDFATQRRFFDATPQLVAEILPTAKAFPDLHANILVKHAVIKMYQGEPVKSSFDLVQEAKTLIRQQPNLAVEAEIMLADGVFLGDQGKLKEAQVSIEKALALKKEECGSCMGIYTIMQHLGDIHNRQNNLDKAKTYYEQVIVGMKKFVETDNLIFIVPNGSLGTVYFKQKNFDKALNQYTKSLKIVEKYFPPTYPDRLLLLGRIGQIYTALGQHPKAIETLGTVLAIQKQTLDANAFDIGTTHRYLGDANTAVSKTDIALSHYQEAYRIYRIVYGEKHPTTQEVAAQVEKAKKPTI